jgi:RecA-family ATPase
MSDDRPSLRRATDMKESQPVSWLLAPNYLVAGRINLLVGEEGCGKSAWAIRAIATVTTGKPWGPFTIAGDARDAVIIATEDGWQDTVRPRLEAAGADLSKVHVFSVSDDGEGVPTFPSDMERLRASGVRPALVVVDSWVDTVQGGLMLKDPQNARKALVPWKEYAAMTGAAVVLVAHTNRIATGNARDTYGLSGALRQAVRSAIYAMRDAETGDLLVGPEKSNTGKTDVPAQRFIVSGAQQFDASLYSDGTVARLDHLGASDRTIKQHLSEVGAQSSNANQSETARIDDWLRSRLRGRGGVPSAELLAEAIAAGFSDDKLQRSRGRIGARTRKEGAVWFTFLAEVAELRLCGVDEDAQERISVTPQDRKTG